MPADIQTLISEAATEAIAYEHELFLENEARLRSRLEEKGMEFTFEVESAV